MKYPSRFRQRKQEWVLSLTVLVGYTLHYRSHSPTIRLRYSHKIRQPEKWRYGQSNMLDKRWNTNHSDHSSPQRKRHPILWQESYQEMRPKVFLLIAPQKSGQASTQGSWFVWKQTYSIKLHDNPCNHSVMRGPVYASFLTVSIIDKEQEIYSGRR